MRGNETVLHIRAFAAGSGDLRRVRDLVSEFFTEHRQPLPSLSLIQSGGLPMEGAQVVFEFMPSRVRTSTRSASYCSRPNPLIAKIRWIRSHR